MHRVRIQTIVEDGSTHYHLHKDVELPFVPMKDLQLGLPSTSMWVTEVGYEVADDHFWVETEVPERIAVQDEGTGAYRDVTRRELVDEMKRDGFQVLIIETAPPARKARRRKAGKARR